MKIGKTIKRLRIESEISQRKLAYEADITPSFLSLIESDRREPSLNTIRKLAEGLNTTLEVIIWDAVPIPENIKGEDRRACELAKLLATRFGGVIGESNGAQP